MCTYPLNGFRANSAGQVPMLNYNPPPFLSLRGSFATLAKTQKQHCHCVIRCFQHISSKFHSTACLFQSPLPSSLLKYVLCAAWWVLVFLFTHDIGQSGWLPFCYLTQAGVFNCYLPTLWLPAMTTNCQLGFYHLLLYINNT